MKSKRQFKYAFFMAIEIFYVLSPENIVSCTPVSIALKMVLTTLFFFPIDIYRSKLLIKK